MQSNFVCPSWAQVPYTDNRFQEAVFLGKVQSRSQIISMFLEKIEDKRAQRLEEKEEINIQRETYNDPYRIESSDPRVYEGLVQHGVRW